MKELFEAILLKNKYNKMDLIDVVREFEQFTGYTIPSDAISEYKFTGLNNCDFLFSDWLNRYGIKNLPQFLNESN